MFPDGPRLAATLTVLAVTVAGCGGDASVADGASGSAFSDLAPSYDAQQPGRRDGRTTSQAQGRGQAPGKTRANGKDRADAGVDSQAGRARPERVRPQRGAGARVGASPKPRAVGRRDQSAPTPAGPVTITDATGDMTATLGSPPASADLTAVEVSRSATEVTVRLTFADTVPTRQHDDSRTTNVASFYDVNGNGVVDYEIWVSLADNGWGTGYVDRRSQQSSFGPATGIEVSVDGATLLTRFPVDRIGGASRFRWSAASEWGSYEAMATSTTARDYAPDDGAAGFPG